MIKNCVAVSGGTGRASGALAPPEVKVGGKFFCSGKFLIISIYLDSLQFHPHKS
jgi:hypothetical protein